MKETKIKIKDFIKYLEYSQENCFGDDEFDQEAKQAEGEFLKRLIAKNLTEVTLKEFFVIFGEWWNEISCEGGDSELLDDLAVNWLGLTNDEAREFIREYWLGDKEGLNEQDIESREDYVSDWTDEYLNSVREDFDI